MSYLWEIHFLQTQYAYSILEHFCNLAHNLPHKLSLHFIILMGKWEMHFLQI